MKFIDRLYQSKPLIIDGAMGTLLFERIPDYTGSFELLNAENPTVVEEVHKLYFEAGSDIVETNTFGGSKIKLAEFNLENRCEELNEKGAAIARNAADHFGKNRYVGGSVGPTGLLIEPMGDVNPEIVYESYKAQMIGLERGGADLIVIETMNDLQEAKLAVMAAKQNTSLPVLCSMTFEENGKTMTGTNMLTGFSTLSEYGADITGANCSMGPEGLVNVFKNSIEEINKIGIPFSVWSNAGLPVFKDGKSIYELSPDDFAKISLQFAKLGVKIIGGCCGTTPAHIKALKEIIEKETFEKKEYKKNYSFLTSRNDTINLNEHKGLLILGERLNPTARKKFSEDLLKDKQTFLRLESKKQIREGAHVLDINVGVPSIDEIKAMHRSVMTLSNIVDAPLMIDSDNADVIKKALMAIPGVPIINSINGNKKSIDTIVPLLKKFGSFAVALCLDELGIHREADKRIAAGERLIKNLEDKGISSDRLFIDPLILAESAEPGSAMETLKVIEHFSKRGIKTSIGLSNISFGLPNRKHINNVFLKMAIEKGLFATIGNPAVLRTIDNYTEEEKLALDFLTGKDEGAVKYIAHFKELNPEKKTSLDSSIDKKDILNYIYTLVVEGNMDEIEGNVKKALEDKEPKEIMNNALLKALEKVGELYSSGEYFLPQMIASANTMKKGFAILKPLLAKSSSEKLGKVVICTVKGDIHDIGKNIVAMMMENHGFEIFDLGKDVESEAIINKAEEINADLICLSSLLTTTMGEMKVVSELIKERNLSAKLIIGGAVVNEDYAKSIEALYGKDAVDGVNKAKFAVTN